MQITANLEKIDTKFQLILKESTKFQVFENFSIVGKSGSRRGAQIKQKKREIREVKKTI